MEELHVVNVLVAETRRPTCTRVQCTGTSFSTLIPDEIKMRLDENEGKKVSL